MDTNPAQSEFRRTPEEPPSTPGPVTTAVRDREAEGSNPSPPTNFRIRVERFPTRSEGLGSRLGHNFQRSRTVLVQQLPESSLGLISGQMNSPMGTRKAVAIVSMVVRLAAIWLSAKRRTSASFR